MEARRYVEVTIELEVGTDPIAGRVRHGEGKSRTFGGWLELAGAIEDALGEPRREADPASSTPKHG